MKKKIIVYGDEGMSTGMTMEDFLLKRNKKYEPMSNNCFYDFFENKIRSIALQIANDIKEEDEYRLLTTSNDASHLNFYAKLNKSLITSPVDEILFFMKTENEKEIVYHVFKTENHFNEFIVKGKKYPHIAEMKFLKLTEEDIYIIKGS